MPVGAMNAHAFFVAMVSKFETKWSNLCGQQTKKSKEARWEWLNAKMEKALRTIKEVQAAAETANAEDTGELSPCKERHFSPTWQKPGEHELLPGLAVIIDDIILVARTATALLHCFIHMIEILQRCCITIKLRKTRFFPARAEFVGVVVTKEGDSPAQSEHDVLQGLDKPLSH
jgi:hypothetical protein